MIINLIPIIQKYKTSPDQIYVLYCIATNQDPSYVNIVKEIRVLRLMGFLDKEMKLTEKANLLLEEIQETKGKKPAPKKQNLTVSLSDKVNEYIELFPKIKLPSGLPARSSKVNIENNFKWFFNTYNYSWDTIINATRLYLEEYETKGYKYMKTSQYFIKKTESGTPVSVLSNYCELYLQGAEVYNDPKSSFKDKVV